MRQILARSIKALGEAENDSVLLQSFETLLQWSTEAVESDNKILFCGNGGSAAEAQHIAAELVGRFKIERPGLAAIALTTDTSILTAVANDYSYDVVFSRQIEALGRNADLLIVLSTSGNSKNCIKACEAARKKGMRSVALTGRTGGQLNDHADLVLKMPSDGTSHIQELHLVILHALCEKIDEKLFR